MRKGGKYLIKFQINRDQMYLVKISRKINDIKDFSYNMLSYENWSEHIKTTMNHRIEKWYLFTKKIFTFNVSKN